MRQPTVEDLLRLREAAKGNPDADHAYVEAWGRASQAVREAVLRGPERGSR